MTQAAPIPPRVDPRLVAVACGVAAGLVALALGAINIGRSFNYDEAYTYARFVNGGSLRRALTTQVVFNNHPMFSVVLAIGWRMGFVGETSQRLAPVTFGAITVGIVAWHTTRRVGVLAGLAASALLALNPQFLAQYRSLRGYSLAALAVLLAALALHRSWTDHRHRWLLAQGACMVLAVTTHSYSALAILMLAAATFAMGRLRRAHVVTWAVSAVVALLVLAPVLDDALDNARARGKRLWSDFPIDLARILLGESTAAALVTGALVVVGLVVVARTSRHHLYGVLAGLAVFGVALVLVWQVARPFDLYPRFFLSLLPLTAIVAGSGIAALPRPVGAVGALAAVALIVPGALDVLDDEPTIRDAAAIVDAARERDLEVCGRFTEPLEVYTPPVTPRFYTDLADCEVYVVIGRLGPDGRDAVAERFSAERNIGGGVRVYADRSVIEVLVATPR